MFFFFIRKSKRPRRALHILLGIGALNSLRQKVYKSPTYIKMHIVIFAGVCSSRKRLIFVTACNPQICLPSINQRTNSGNFVQLIFDSQKHVRYIGKTSNKKKHVNILRDVSPCVHKKSGLKFTMSTIWYQFVS